LGLALRILEAAALLLLAALMLATLAWLRVALLLLAALTRFRVLTLLLLARLSRLGRLLFVLTHCVSPEKFGGWTWDRSHFLGYNVRAAQLFLRLPHLRHASLRRAKHLIPFVIFRL
jgi:hypothetical protein